MKYIKCKGDLVNFLNYEFRKYGLSSRSYPLVAFSENKILYKFNYLLRHLEYYTNCNKPLRKVFIKLIFIRYTRKYLTFIPINVFDKGLKLVHIGQRLVNGGAIVGKDCTLHINTFMVAGGVNDFAPVIGDNCIFGVNSVVLGNAKIGDNVAVGAGAVVNKDFSEGNMTLGGVPAKKISLSTRNDWAAEKRKMKG